MPYANGLNSFYYLLSSLFRQVDYRFDDSALARFDSSSSTSKSGQALSVRPKWQFGWPVESRSITLILSRIVILFGKSLEIQTGPSLFFVHTHNAIQFWRAVRAALREFVASKASKNLAQPKHFFSSPLFFCSTTPVRSTAH